MITTHRPTDAQYRLAAARILDDAGLLDDRIADGEDAITLTSASTPEERAEADARFAESWAVKRVGDHCAWVTVRVYVRASETGGA